jgi:hypothetical protein
MSKNAKRRFQEWKDQRDQEQLAENAIKEKAWPNLGTGYPGVDVRIRAAFDVLAPVFDDSGHPILDDDGNPSPPERVPVYEQDQEKPTPDEVWSLARTIVDAVRAAS